MKKIAFTLFAVSVVCLVGSSELDARGGGGRGGFGGGQPGGRGGFGGGQPGGRGGSGGGQPPGDRPQRPDGGADRERESDAVQEG